MIPADPTALPAGLRERVLEASMRAREAGRPVPDIPGISAAEAFSRAADAFYGLLCALGEGDWSKPALRGLDVQGLVGHLTGVEEDVHRCLAGDPDVADASHIESTQAMADRQAGRSAAARTGLTEPLDVHLVLTGPGGGTWEVAVGQSPPEPAAVSIVTDAVGFCRLAGNRATPADLDLHITGDAGRAVDVLVAASTLALD